jgi:hypothetical protein
MDPTLIDFVTYISVTSREMSVLFQEHSPIVGRCEKKMIVDGSLVCTAIEP